MVFAGDEGGDSRHTALLLLVLATQRALLAANGEAVPPALVAQLQDLVSPQPDADLAAENAATAAAALLLQCSALRYEAGGSGVLVKGEPCFEKVLPTARTAFTLCQQHPGHAQLVCIALRAFGEALVADGCVPALVEHAGMTCASLW